MPFDLPVDKIPHKLCTSCFKVKIHGDFGPCKDRWHKLSNCCKKCQVKKSNKCAVKRKNNFKGRPESGTKVCLFCKEKKDISEFNTDKRQKGGLSPWCSPCGRDRKLLWQHGIDPAQYQAIFDFQKGICPICLSPPTTSHATNKKNKRERFHVDHNHETGEVRGLLCPYCNIGLGNFKDNIQNLRRAIKFLENPPTRQMKL